MNKYVLNILRHTGLATGALLLAAPSFAWPERQKISTPQNTYEFSVLRSGKNGIPEEAPGRLTITRAKSAEIIYSLTTQKKPGCEGFKTARIFETSRAKRIIILCGSTGAGKHETLFAVSDDMEPNIAMLDFGTSEANLIANENIGVSVVSNLLPSTGSYGVLYLPVAYYLTSDSHRGLTFDPMKFGRGGGDFATQYLKKFTAMPTNRNSAAQFYIAVNSLLQSSMVCEVLRAQSAEMQRILTRDFQISLARAIGSEFTLCE